VTYVFPLIADFQNGSNFWTVDPTPISSRPEYAPVHQNMLNASHSPPFPNARSGFPPTGHSGGFHQMPEDDNQYEGNDDSWEEVDDQDGSAGSSTEE